MAGRLLSHLLVLVVLLAVNGRLVFTGVTSYQQLVALVAETYIIGKQPAFVAHILDEHHFMVLEHLFLFRCDFGTHDSVVDLQLFPGLLECDVHYSRIDESDAGKQRVVFTLYVVDGKLSARGEDLLLFVIQSFPVDIIGYLDGVHRHGDDAVARFMKGYITVADRSRMGILHLLDSPQSPGVLERLFFLVREYSLIGRQVILRFVESA